MFALDFDHLNVFIILVLALITFRGYQRQTLAIEYQSEDEEVSVEKQQEKLDGEESHLREERWSQQVRNDQEGTKIEVPSQNINVDSQAPISSLISFQTVEIISSQIPEAMNEEPALQNVNSQLQKQYDQDSTFLNRNQQIQSQQEGSQNFSSDNLSQGSQNIDEGQNQSARQKRKRIHKLKRRAKKLLRKQENQNQVENSTQEVIVIE